MTKKTAIIKNKEFEGGIKELNLDEIDIIIVPKRKKKLEIPFTPIKKEIEVGEEKYEKERCENCGNDKFYLFYGSSYRAYLICTKCKEYIPLEK